MQSNFRVEFEQGRNSALPKSDVIAWLQASRTATSTYFGQFPLADVDVTIRDEDGGDSVGFGSTTWDEGRGIIEIDVGTNIEREDLMRSWTAVHEMCHLAFPIVAHRDRWVAEGMATYIEPIARLQAGQRTPQQVWRDLVQNGESGLPSNATSGMGGTREWGRTYWGGAFYCLLADIQIRKATNNRLGFQDAMRAIVKAGATADSDYSAEQALAIGDKALGIRVLVPLYQKMSTEPTLVDLNGLWRNLGVIEAGRTVRFDETAPLAYIRRSIERGHS